MAEADNIQALQKRRQFFADHLPDIGQSSREHTGSSLKTTCPACGFPTLGERDGWEICRFCCWEDDGQDDAAADEVWGGPNGSLSLTQRRLEIADRLTRLLDESGERTEAEVQAGQALAKLQSLMDTYSTTDESQLRQYLGAAIKALVRSGADR